LPNENWSDFETILIALPTFLWWSSQCFHCGLLKPSWQTFHTHSIGDRCTALHHWNALTSWYMSAHFQKSQHAPQVVTQPLML
jgi:hypothetical protein